MLLPLLAGAMCVSGLAAAPQIQFEKTVYDFGKVSVVESVTGSFKYKNVGDAVLKIEPPKASCGCTVAELKQDSLKPGESGELAFTFNLGRVRAEMAKQITITSNDPKTPVVGLTIKADYTPLYELNPLTLAPELAFGVDKDEQFASLTRTDGKALKIVKLESSKPWITASVVAGASADTSAARIKILIRREGEPRRFSEYVHVYTEGQEALPSASIGLHGQLRGEVGVIPEALYWSINDAATAPTDRPESMVLRRILISSAGGKPLQLKNPRSTIPGVVVEILPKEAGKSYELVARLKDVPKATVGGNVSFETSVAGQPRIEVPMIVNVFQAQVR